MQNQKELLSFLLEHANERIRNAVNDKELTHILEMRRAEINNLLLTVISAQEIIQEFEDEYSKILQEVHMRTIQLIRDPLDAGKHNQFIK